MSSAARGAVFNVGTGGRISLLDLVAAINAVLGTHLEPEFLPVRPGDVRDSQASLDRIRAVLGYEPVVAFEEGLRRTIESLSPHELGMPAQSDWSAGSATGRERCSAFVASEKPNSIGLHAGSESDPARLFIETDLRATSSDPTSGRARGTGRVESGRLGC